jgi:hypothetical protein
VAVRDVDEEDVGPGLYELGGAFQEIAASADRRSDAKAPLVVGRRFGLCRPIEDRSW